MGGPPQSAMRSVTATSPSTPAIPVRGTRRTRRKRPTRRSETKIRSLPTSRPMGLFKRFRRPSERACRLPLWPLGIPEQASPWSLPMLGFFNQAGPECRPIGCGLASRRQSRSPRSITPRTRLRWLAQLVGRRELQCICTKTRMDRGYSLASLRILERFHSDKPARLLVRLRRFSFSREW